LHHCEIIENGIIKIAAWPILTSGINGIEWKMPEVIPARP
jgi:hypothetical protein